MGSDGRSVSVVSGPPAPEVGPDGTPMVTLLGAQGSASLNVGVRWWPSEAELHRLLADVARRQKCQVSELRVVADALSDVRSALFLAGDGGRELVASAGSGTPPYTTVLSVQLAGDDVEPVRRALFGQAGVLQVRCTAESSDGCISGQADVSEWTKARPDVHVVMIAPS